MTDGGQVSIDCQPANDGWLCRVEVSEGRSATSHEVTVSRAELEQLAGRSADATRLVQVSFDYLLEREPKESILRRFAISDIERYFLAYPDEIKARLGG